MLGQLKRRIRDQTIKGTAEAIAAAFAGIHFIDL